MTHDRDEKFEGQEDSEYHFSDEEINYDAESGMDSDSAKQAAPAPTPSELRADMIKKLAGSKRVIISVAVFVGLVFIVYKMVSGGSGTPGTDIAPQAMTAQQTNTSKNPAQSPMAQPTAMNASVPAQPQQTNQQAPQAVMQAQVPMPAPAAIQTQAVQPTQTQQLPQSPGPQLPAQPTMAAITTTSTQPGPTAPPMPVQQANAAAQQAAVAGMPAMIPVQSNVPTQTASTNAQILNGQIPADVQAKISNLSAQGDQAVAQLQAQYTQKINDYAAQNKALQDQVDTLNARVISMENQMSQMMKGLQQSGSNAPTAAPTDSSATPAPAPQRAEPKISYNVQAIIPGRAWLRSDGGETLTVAEGDMVKDLGRVSKIDPYDGVVEINTGNRIVSLSYGNSG